MHCWKIPWGKMRWWNVLCSGNPATSFFFLGGGGEEEEDEVITGDLLAPKKRTD